MPSVLAFLLNLSFVVHLIQGFGEGSIRLVDGVSNNIYGQSPFSGRVEICHDAVWGTMCDDVVGSGNDECTVLCRQLGYSTCDSFDDDSLAPDGTDPTWLDDVDCIGSESSIGDCDHNDFGDEDCGHWEDVNVQCSGFVGGVLYEPEICEHPTYNPTYNPTVNPTLNPTYNPTVNPSELPTKYPTSNPTPCPVPVPIPCPDPVQAPPVLVPTPCPVPLPCPECPSLSIARSSEDTSSQNIQSADGLSSNSDSNDFAALFNNNKVENDDGDTLEDGHIPYIYPVVIAALFILWGALSYFYGRYTGRKQIKERVDTMESKMEQDF